MDGFDLKEIKGRFTNSVYQRGVRYFQDGRVGDLYQDSARQIWAAKVRGSKSYQVEIEEDEDWFSYECNCPAFDKYNEPCKHIAAVLLKIHQQEHSSFFHKNSPNPNEQRAKFRQEQEERQKQRQLEYERQRERQTRLICQATNQ